MKVNGENFDYSVLAPEFNLEALLQKLSLSPKRVAVELNGNLIGRANYPGCNLAENDTVEIIHYVGGG